MLNCKIMMNLLILFYNIFLGSAYSVINCDCDKNDQGYEESANAKTSTYQMYKQVFQLVGTSYISTDDQSLGLADSNSELFDLIEPDVTTEVSYCNDFHPCPPEPHPEPFTHPTDKPKPGPPLLCSIENQTVDSDVIFWPETNKGESAKSNPLCLDVNMMIVKRKCEDTDTWEAAPDCVHIQHDIIDPCPSDLQNFKNKYCYTIINETTFPPACPYPETIGWDEYVNLDLTKLPIWMPVKREDIDDYGTDVMRFTELTHNYMIPYEICTQSCLVYFYSGTFSDKSCQIYHNSTHVEAVNCNELHSAVCVYHALPERTKSYCSQVYSVNDCKQSGYNTNSACFCEADNKQQIGDAAFIEFLLPYQNLIYNNLRSTKLCHMGLVKTERQSPFVWSASNTLINYTNWATDVEINFDNTFGVFTSHGWILENEKNQDCILYQIPGPTTIGKLSLDIEEDLFKVTVLNYKSFLCEDNGEPLVYCFTDADANSVIYRIENLTIAVTDSDNIIYTFPGLNIPQSGPGNYWCQAFAYPDLEILTTEIKSLHKYDAEYVAILKLHDYEEKLSSYPLTAENLATLQNLYKNELENILTFFPRLFKINEVNESNKELTITFHLSSSTAKNTENVFDTLKAASMTQRMFEFIDFRYVDYCAKTTTRQVDGQIITWPLTKLGGTSDPENGFCVTDDVNFIERTCEGNFIDGAYWSDLTENCTFYASSSQTKLLIEITRSSVDLYDSALSDLLKITESYGSFNTLDLVLTAKFLNAIEDMKPNLETFAGIINNVMKISRPILLSSQLNFKATDYLLLSLDKALEEGDFNEYKTENFAIKSIDIRNNGIYGVLLENCTINFSGCDLSLIDNSTQLFNESFISASGIVAAIALSETLYDQINNYAELNSSYIPKLVVSIYYGSQLFVELDTQKFSNYVFGILLPGFTEDFKGPLSIYYYSNMKNNYLGYNCSYWDFSDPVHSSWADEGTENTNQAVYCEFNHITNFGIPFTLAEEYCDVGQNAEENLACDLKISTNAKMSLVKYLKVCEPDEDMNVEYKNVIMLVEEFISCTILTDANKDLLLEYCITGDAMVIPIKCFENFDKEYDSFNIIENCDTYYTSNLSKTLLETLAIVKADCWGIILNILLRYSQENYLNFSELDILLIGSMMNPIATKEPNLHTISEIINNLMKTPRPILKDAQKNLKAIDVLLHNTEETLKNGECGEWKTENFIIKCLDINTENMGLSLQSCSSDFTSCTTSNMFDIDNIYESYFILNNNTQATISLTEDLYNQIITYGYQNSSYTPKMIVSLYNGSQLFVDLEDDPFEKHVFSFIFGILLPDFHEEFQSPIQIYYLNNGTSQNILQYNCSYWKYNKTSYGSWTTENSGTNSHVAKCEFNHVTNFAISIESQKYSHFVNTQTDELDSVNSTLFCKLQERNIIFNEKYSIYPVKNKKYELQKYNNEYSVNGLIMVNILDKIGIFSNNYFPHFAVEHYFDNLDPFIPTVRNKLTANTSPQIELMLNQSVNLIQQTPNSVTFFSNRKNQHLYNLYEENKNITYELEIIHKKVSSNNLDNRLPILEGLVPKLINDLNEYDIELIAELLQNSDSLANLDSLKQLANVISIMMTIPRNIMFQAQLKFKSADKILYFIDKSLEKFLTSVQIIKENVIFFVISKEDVLDFYGFYVTKKKEVVYITNKNKEKNKPDDSEIDFLVIISPQLHEQIRVNKTKIIFILFYNDIYFPDSENSDVTKPIVEVLFPDLKEQLTAAFTITYKFSYDLSQYSKCSYWDHLVTTNKVVRSGSWKKEFPAQINGSWVTCIFNHATHFALVTSSQNITTDLEFILNSNLTGLEKLKQVDTITDKSYASLLPVDIFLISQIMGASLTEGAVAQVISKIVSNLFNVPSDVLKQSQEFHTATDIILHNVDKMAEMLDDTFISYDNFSLIVKDLNSVNLTGLLLHSCNESYCSIDEFNDFVNISDYVNDDKMSAMLVFSQKLIAQIKNLRINSKVIISIYYSNAFFNEIGNDRNTTKVFGIVIPGLNASIDGEVSVIYNVGSMINDRHQCAYWDYQVDPDGNIDNSSFGKWQNDTSRTRQGNVAICNFSHVTHFSMLLSNNDDSNDDALLNIITDIGCILSILGMAVILLTAIFFKKWRQNTGNKILINFSIAISLKIAMLYISVYVKSSSTGIGCTLSGTLLHYSILSECAWMLTIAILQFKRFVEVLGGPPKYVLVKALICGWIFPIVPVICVLLIDPDNYLEGNAGLCYPSNLGLYLGVWLPVIIIVSINCVIFIFIIYNVFHKKTEYIDSANNEILFQWRLALLLFFMLGLTWLFGFLSEINGDTLFTYVFCITASMQGFVLFLFFIVFNKSTRVLYSHHAKQWFYSKRIFKLWQSKSQNEPYA